MEVAPSSTLIFAVNYFQVTIIRHVFLSFLCIFYLPAKQRDKPGEEKDVVSQVKLLPSMHSPFIITTTSILYPYIFMCMCVFVCVCVCVMCVCVCLCVCLFEVQRNNGYPRERLLAYSTSLISYYILFLPWH